MSWLLYSPHFDYLKTDYQKLDKYKHWINDEEFDWNSPALKEDVENTATFFDISYYFNMPLDQCFELTEFQIVLYQQQIARIKHDQADIQAYGVATAFNEKKGGE